MEDPSQQPPAATPGGDLPAPAPPDQPAAPVAWPAAPPQPPFPPATGGGSWAVPADAAGPAPGLVFASHGARLVAYIIDAILVGIIVTLLAMVLGIITAALALGGSFGLAALSGVFLVVILFVVSIGYFPWFWTHGGATPGMRLFRLRVVRDRDGGPIGWGAAILRLIGYWISSFVFYLGFIWILIDGRRRGWHDLIAGTVMVQPA